MSIELRIPTAGESITEVEVGEWRKSEGDRVKRDEILVEIETDKASMELPSPSDGVLGKILKQAGEPAKVNDVIAFIESGAQGSGESKRGKTEWKHEKTESKQEKKEPAKSKAKEASPAPAGKSSGSKGNGASAAPMPAAQRLMKEKGIDAANVEGTGRGGRILKEDVTRHLEQDEEKAEEKTEAKPDDGDEPQASSAGGDREEEVVRMSLLRRRIAARLVEAQQTAALLTTFNEVDMSAVMQLRKQYQESFQKKYDVKIGFMSFFIKAAIDALKAFPAVNAEIRDEDIVYKNYYDIGVAVGTDKGLVVPVIRDAEHLSFAELELAIGDFGTRAREGKLSVDELTGGTFTISNGGVYGSRPSRPVRNSPQSAILGLHSIQDRPVAIDGEVVVRPMMYLALSYDHRIIDGKEAVTFLKRIKECIETPTRMLIEV